MRLVTAGVALAVALAAPRAPAQAGQESDAGAAEDRLIRLLDWDRAMAEALARPGSLSGLEREMSALYLELVPSLVEVRSVVAGADGSRGISTAGVVLTADGLVVAPVFPRSEAGEGDAHVEVRRADGRSYLGRVIQREESYGLSLIRVDELRGMQPKLFPGEWVPEGAPVIALGNAFGLDASMSLGLLSGRARFAGKARRLLQITNPVNPGDGGGLLASSRGEVIGILLTALPELAEAGVAVGVERVREEPPTQLGADRGRALRADGIGFAVPIEIVIGLFPEQLGSLMQRKRMLGVEASGRLMVIESPEGPARRWVVEIVGVLPDSAAAAAGLAAEDVLLDLNGVPIATLEDLGFAMFHAPQRTTLTVLRAGAPLRLDLDFGAWKAPLPEFGARPPRAPEPPAGGDGG